MEAIATSNNKVFFFIGVILSAQLVGSTSTAVAMQDSTDLILERIKEDSKQRRHLHQSDTLITLLMQLSEFTWQFAQARADSRG